MVKEARTLSRLGADPKSLIQMVEKGRVKYPFSVLKQQIDRGDTDDLTQLACLLLFHFLKYSEGIISDHRSLFLENAKVSELLGVQYIEALKENLSFEDTFIDLSITWGTYQADEFTWMDFLKSLGSHLPYEESPKYLQKQIKKLYKKTPPTRQNDALNLLATAAYKSWYSGAAGQSIMRLIISALSPIPSEIKTNLAYTDSFTYLSSNRKLHKISTNKTRCGIAMKSTRVPKSNQVFGVADQCEGCGLGKKTIYIPKRKEHPGDIYLEENELTERSWLMVKTYLKEALEKDGDLSPLKIMDVAKRSFIETFAWGLGYYFIQGEGSVKEKLKTKEQINLWLEEAIYQCFEELPQDIDDCTNIFLKNLKQMDTSKELLG